MNWIRCEIGRSEGVEVFAPVTGARVLAGPLVEHLRAKRAPYEGQLIRAVQNWRKGRSAELRRVYDEIREREKSPPRTITEEDELRRLRAKAQEIEEKL